VNEDADVSAGGATRVPRGNEDPGNVPPATGKRALISTQPFYWLPTQAVANGQRQIRAPWSSEGMFGEADPGALGRGERLLGDVLRWQLEMLVVAGCSEADLEVLALDVPPRVRVAVRLVKPMNIGDSMISWSP
jgi:hypothetical protein